MFFTSKGEDYCELSSRRVIGDELKTSSVDPNNQKEVEAKEETGEKDKSVVRVNENETNNMSMRSLGVVEVGEEEEEEVAVGVTSPSNINNSSLISNRSGKEAAIGDGGISNSEEENEIEEDMSVLSGSNRDRSCCQCCCVGGGGGNDVSNSSLNKKFRKRQIGKRPFL